MTLAHRYGPRVVYVDLLSGVRDSEAKLVNALEEVLRAFAAERRDFPPVKHIHYDFHAQASPHEQVPSAFGSETRQREIDR